MKSIALSFLSICVFSIAAQAQGTLSSKEGADGVQRKSGSASLFQTSSQGATDKSGSGDSSVGAQSSAEHLSPEAGPVRALPSKVNIFVSATTGSDNWTGKLALPNAANTDGPLQTMHAARLAVQKVQQKYSAAGVKLRQVLVQFEAGTYFLPGTENFTQADSGVNGTEVIYENYKTDQPVISGGIAVTGWTKMSTEPDGATTWQAPVPHVYFQNLYYNDVRWLRPRVAVNFIGPIAAVNGYLGTYFRIVGQVSIPQSGPTNNCPNQDPNDPTKYICNDRFAYDSSDPISSTWQNLTAPASPPSSTCKGNPASVAPVGDIELVDFEQYHAAKLRVNCIDTTDHIVYLTAPTSHSAETQHAGADGFLPGHRYLVENVKDYLTQPRQWFLDQSTWMLTLVTDGDDPNNANVVIPQQAQLIVAGNLQNVTFQGLTFAHDNYVTDQQKGYSGADPIPAAVSFQASSDIIFQGNIVKETSGTGVDFISCTTPSASNPYRCVSFSSANTTTNNMIKDSAFYDLGAGGIRVAQFGEQNDSMTNIPNSNEVNNNVVEGYGRVFPGSVGIEQGNGRNNTYTHNEVYDGYKGAIHVCYCNSSGTPLTNNNVISFNLVHDLLQGIMNDGGSLYVGVGSPSPKSTGTGNQMMFNVVHDVNDASVLDPSSGYGGDGLYVDDFTSDVDVESNLVYRVSGHAISFSGPRPPGFPPSTVKNNIFAFARLSMVNAYNPYSFGAPVPFQPAPLFFEASNNLFYFDRSDSSTPEFHVQGGCAFAGTTDGVTVAPYTGFEQWSHNLYFRTTGTPFDQDPNAFHTQTKNVTVGTCGGEDANARDWSLYYLNLPAAASWTSQGEDAGSIVKDPGFRNPAYPSDNYALSKSPLKGFKKFDPTQAGRTSPVIVPPPVAATFLTGTFNPVSDY